MKKSILSFFLFGAILSAAPVNVTFVDAGKPLVVAQGNYVGPYDLTVNGVATPAMCMDDFRTVGGSWTAYETAVSGSNLSKTFVDKVEYGSFYSHGVAFTDSSAYKAEAYLFSEITAPNADRASLQMAAWAVFDPYLSLGAHDQSLYKAFQNAVADSQNFDTTGYEILSDMNNAAPNQEFMIKINPASATPEPATFALMGGGLFAAGVAGFFRRRKQTEVTA